MRLVFAASAIVLALASGGCKDRRAAGEGLGDRGTSATTPATKSAASSARAASADPRLKELLTRALACRWDSAGPNPTCEDARRWRDARDVLGEGREDATLVAMLEDGDDRVRQLAAQALAIYGARFRADRELSERVVQAAESERSDRAGAAVGDALARVDVERTNLFERIRAIAMKHVVLPLRVALVAELAHQNPASSPAFTLTLDLLSDSEKPVRTAAIGALWVCSNRHPEEACAAWRARIDDGDAELAAKASDYLTWAGTCQAHYEALLASEERRAKDARLGDPLFAKALGNVCDDPRASTRERERATDLVKRFAEQKTTDRFVRAAALEQVLRCDPAAQAFVARFAKDEDEHVKHRATELLRPR